MKQPQNLTVFLERWRAGDESAAGELLAAAYHDLRRLAGGYMRGERSSHTLQPTALLHEAWMRLDKSNGAKPANREEFLVAMAGYMRRHLVDHARRRKAEKRGGAYVRADFDDVASVLPAAQAGHLEQIEPELRLLDEALIKLEGLNPRAARVVELRMFANKSVEEAAKELALSAATVKRDFALARVFLLGELTRSA